MTSPRSSSLPSRLTYGRLVFISVPGIPSSKLVSSIVSRPASKRIAAAAVLVVSLGVLLSPITTRASVPSSST